MRAITLHGTGDVRVESVPDWFSQMPTLGEFIERARRSPDNFSKQTIRVVQACEGGLRDRT